jgi:multidrug efflux pump subunit AcrA (membrane-fusion protein)
LIPSSWPTQLKARADHVIASVDADNAAVDTAQTNLDYTSIVAPSDAWACA